MSDQQRCPECGGSWVAGEVEHVRPVCCGNTSLAECCGQPMPEVEVEQVPCDSCDGTGKKPTEKLVGTVPGQELLVLPADLIDRAVEVALRDAATDASLDEHRNVTVAVAPLLVEHGRQQEKARWEARIEKYDDAIELVATFRSGAYVARDRSEAHRAVYETLDGLTVAIAELVPMDLRSLLTGEGENGE